ncbi:unnamed protein product [Prorocentrum cordatum]|uniref:Reverse transcriptase domain-containing protein n=1 Tax=Prorocentrum cordatum TaxID=2364126 RepID=A0ABN9X7I4_9DINO|nr:unnamed protein product [Polarella glacialis]
MVALYKGAGDISDLDNWRGICLLQILSKVAAKLVSDVFRCLGECVLDEGQMGFRPLRGCMDAVFVLRRVFEEVRATRAPAAGADEGVYALFVDLRTGLAPALWDLYYDCVVKDWRRRLVEARGHKGGCAFMSSHDLDLSRPRGETLRAATAAAHRISDVAYADDLVTLHASLQELQVAAQLLADAVEDWGGELNAKKTKWMCVRSGVLPVGLVEGNLTVDGHVIEQVCEFKYLGSIVSNDASLGQRADVMARIRAASTTFGRLRSVWSDGRIAMTTKRLIFLACVRPTLLYGAECWALRGPEVQALRRAWHGWLRSILGERWGLCRTLIEHFRNIVRRVPFVPELSWVPASSDQIGWRGVVKKLRCGLVFTHVGHRNEHVAQKCPLRSLPADVGDCRDGAGFRCPYCEKRCAQASAFAQRVRKCPANPANAGAARAQRYTQEKTLPCQHCGSPWAYESLRRRREERCRHRG